MKLTDIPFSPFSLKLEFTKDMDEYLMEIFTDFLQEQNLISKSVLNKTLGIWIDSVDYDTFSDLFDSFWKQKVVDEIPGAGIGMAIMGIAIQIASILSRMKPPERSILRDSAKTRIAIKLVDSIAQP
ncbi:MAG: hypothetical protein ACRC2V_18850 [Xenococcaceae cyanobacterium]